MSNWTDLHFVDPCIKVKREYYPDIVMSHCLVIWNLLIIIQQRNW